MQIEKTFKPLKKVEDYTGADQPKSMKRELKLIDATLLVVGSMIGSGIFIVAADMTRNVGSAGWLIMAWVITGMMRLIIKL